MAQQLGNVSAAAQYTQQPEEQPAPVYEPEPAPQPEPVPEPEPEYEEPEPEYEEPESEPEYDEPDISDEELISAAEEKYNIFHIHIDKGTNTDDRVFADWQKLLPGRTAAVEKNDISILSELIYALISVGEGSTPNEALSSVEQCAAEKAAKSLAYINISDNNTISF
jgi:outer membrane biosynthesis protein TonB